MSINNEVPGPERPEPDNESERPDLAQQALLAARVIVCKLMDERPFHLLGVLQFETENRWLRAPTFTEGWVSDQHICYLVSQLPSDVAWSFFMWETRPRRARDRWGADADELRRLHDRVESWIRRDVIPAWELYTLDQSPRPSHGRLEEVLTRPSGTRTTRTYAAPTKPGIGSNYMRPFDETGEPLTGARRKTHWFSSDSDPYGRGWNIGAKGGWSGRPARAFTKPRGRKPRPPYSSISKRLQRAAYAAGYTLEAFIAPFPRGHLSAAEEHRRDALARAVHEIRANGSQVKQIARALSVNGSTVNRSTVNDFARGARSSHHRRRCPARPETTHLQE
jgi:hypothetical protein